MEVFKTEERFSGIQFGKDFALVEDQARITAPAADLRDRSGEAQRRSEADLEPQFAGSL